MSLRYCPSMEDHEWVTEDGETFCQACGLSVEDAAEHHAMSIESTTDEQRASVAVQRLVLPLELAFIRWSVVHRGWHEIGGDCPLLLAFLAGWSCRCIGASIPEDVGQFRDSFRVGWREADYQITIASRQNAELSSRL